MQLGTATQSLKFINHRGFVRKVLRVTANGGSTYTDCN